jgi:hypothetical protein
VRHSGFRLRTIMVVIAVVAILMGLGAMRRRDPGSHFIDIIGVADLDSDRSGGLTESWMVWIRVVQSSPNALIRFLIHPSIVENGSREPGVTTAVYFIPLEYVATLVIVSATTILMLVDYLARRRRRAALRRGRDASPHHEASTNRQAGAGPKLEDRESAG